MKGWRAPMKKCCRKSADGSGTYVYRVKPVRGKWKWMDGMRRGLVRDRIARADVRRLLLEREVSK